jgi:hypothetical protein
MPAGMEKDQLAPATQNRHADAFSKSISLQWMHDAAPVINTMTG